MIAHLDMYDRPEIAAANNRFWSAIRTHLGDGPETLTRGADYWQVWHNPDLILSQTCGMPYRTQLHGKVTLVGTPDYGLAGCPPGYYCSIFVAHKSAQGKTLADFNGARFAYNEAGSQSGWAAPKTHMMGRNVTPGSLLATGGHQNSARAVFDRRADFAALDGLTWELIRTHDAFAKDLIEIERTTPTPSLPFITAQDRDPVPIRAAIRAALRDMNPEDRAALHLKDFLEIPAEVYLAVPTPPGPET